MKILAGVDGTTLAGHFGHSEDFLIYTIEDKRISDRERITNPGHTETMNPPEFVATLGVDVVIGGTIGETALNILREAGIEGFFGVTGEADDAVEAYLRGELENDEIASQTGC